LELLYYNNSALELLIGYYKALNLSNLAVKMNTKIKIVYWKGEKFWLGKILEHPEIMSQGETVEELEKNLKMLIN